MCANLTQGAKMERRFVVGDVVIVRDQRHRYFMESGKVVQLTDIAACIEFDDHRPTAWFEMNQLELIRQSHECIMCFAKFTDELVDDAGSIAPYRLNCFGCGASYYVDDMKLIFMERFAKCS